MSFTCSGIVAHAIAAPWSIRRLTPARTDQATPKTGPPRTDVSRKDCRVPRGEPHRPHFKTEHGSGLASTGNATVKLPHCSQVGLKGCLSIEAMLISILMFRTSKN